ncbi:MAG: hypothetical protein IPP63_17350 [Chloracidobacterium sp.]|nr:hypothetical protein [Chloracidobacterium sp.]
MKRRYYCRFGGIGEAAALLLREWSDFETTVILGDVDQGNLRKAQDFVTANSEKQTAVETVVMDREDE